MARSPEVLAPLGEIHAGHGSVEDVGNTLFGKYVLPFELVSVLILAAIFGGVVLAKKKL
jgi:NADH-quinone oxidoreductase subunit J